MQRARWAYLILQTGGDESHSSSAAHAQPKMYLLLISLIAGTPSRRKRQLQSCTVAALCFAARQEAALRDRLPVQQNVSPVPGKCDQFYLPKIISLWPLLFRGLLLSFDGGESSCTLWWTHYRDYKVGFVYITVLMHRRVVKGFSVYQGQQWSLREAGGSPTFFPASFLEEYLAIIGGDNIAGSGQ